MKNFGIDLNYIQTIWVYNNKKTMTKRMCMCMKEALRMGIFVARKTRKIITIVIFSYLEFFSGHFNIFFLLISLQRVGWLVGNHRQPH